MSKDQDWGKDNFIFTQSYVLIQKTAMMIVIVPKKNPYVAIESAEVCYVVMTGHFADD